MRPLCQVAKSENSLDSYTKTRRHIFIGIIYIFNIVFSAYVNVASARSGPKNYNSEEMMANIP